jgi:NADH-quinone oxidoreductase subunit K
MFQHSDILMTFFPFFIYIIISGMIGLVLPFRNLLMLLICLELILLGISGLFVFYAIILPDLLGHVVAFVLITLAGAESALGLALVMLVYRTYKTIDLASLAHLKG